MLENHFKDVRKDFPILNRTFNGKPMIYFDNGATTQKPRVVLDAVQQYYANENANPHRGAYTLSEEATAIYENGRQVVADFIHAAHVDEIIFTKNASESLNLIAYSYGLTNLKAGDEILISILEHHSNLVPWQYVAQKTGATLKFIYLTEDGRIDLENAKSLMNERTKIFSITGMSNALGTIPPVKELIAHAHSLGAIAIVDGAQSVPHMRTDVQELDADFLTFSGHKMFSEMGIGVLYGKRELLQEMPPFLFGGDMIEYVEEQTTTFAAPPARFEAGTQDVGGVASLSAAVKYMNQFSWEEIENYERELLIYAVEKMKEISFIKLFGTEHFEERGPIISFAVEEVHAHDVATILNASGICVRSGHHCAQPLMKYLGVQSTCRASFTFYNTKEEVDFFVESLKDVRKWLGYGS